MKRTTKKSASKKTAKRKAIQKVARRRNPVNLNKDNLRRWAYLNIPKMYDEGDDLYRESVRKASKYFNSDESVIRRELGPYLQHWISMTYTNMSRKDISRLWKMYLIDEPYLLEHG